MKTPATQQVPDFRNTAPEAMPTQTEEQRQNALRDAGITTPTGAITSADLAAVPSVDTAASPPPKNFGPKIDSSLEALLANFNATTPQETAQTDLGKQLVELQRSLGTEATRKNQLEQQAGLPEKNKELQSVINQLQALSKERAAIPLQIQQDFAGTGATVGGVAPIEAGRTRENTIKALGLAAIGQTLQGDITLANATIQSALDAEFEPIRNEIEVAKLNYQNNKDMLERIDKKRSDNLNIILNERDRLLKAQEMEKTSIYQTGIESARNGASQQEVQDIYNSGSREEAAAKASGFLSAEFRRTQEQQQFQNMVTLRNLEINEAQLRLAQDKVAVEKAQREYDIQNGVLDDKQLRDVDTSPQGKNLKVLGDFAIKLANYRSLIDKYGTASVGKQKSELEAAYNDLKLSFKDVKGLGAIQAPDVPLIEGSLKDATFANPISQIFAKTTGGGRIGTIDAALDQVEKAIQDAGTAHSEQLLARDPAYKNSAYVQTLITPLLSTRRFVTINGQNVRVGEIIVNDQGQSGRVEQDGSVTLITSGVTSSTPAVTK